jgi:hypothetical protein
MVATCEEEDCGGENKQRPHKCGGPRQGEVTDDSSGNSPSYKGDRVVGNEGVDKSAEMVDLLWE